jgi:hypothetical protein
MKQASLLSIYLLVALVSCEPYQTLEVPIQKVEALALWQNFNDNTAEAEVLYNGKVLEISGWATYWPANAYSKGHVCFEWRGKEIVLVHVQGRQASLFAPMEKDKWPRRIAMKGTCQGVDADGKVHFKNPTAVDLGE